MKFRESWFDACVWVYSRYEYYVSRVFEAFENMKDLSKLK